MNILHDIRRLDVKLMENVELDAGFAMAIGLPTRIEYVSGERFVAVQREGEWHSFSPTGSWDDFGYAVSRLGGGLVMSVHRDDEAGVVNYYSAHAFLSGTTFYSKSSMLLAASMAAVAYAKLRHWHRYIALDS